MTEKRDRRLRYEAKLAGTLTLRAPDGLLRRLERARRRRGGELSRADLVRELLERALDEELGSADPPPEAQENV